MDVAPTHLSSVHMHDLFAGLDAPTHGHTESRRTNHRHHQPTNNGMGTWGWGWRRERDPPPPTSRPATAPLPVAQVLSRQPPAPLYVCSTSDHSAAHFTVHTRRLTHK
eukprot:scaffold86523_cov31-Tisochrysis_lutea.AAC.4